jgi:hypothetical protein
MPINRPRRPSHRSASLTPSEADRAIYIDFEGFTDRSPDLVGILCEENFKQVVLKRLLVSTSSSGSTSFQPIQSILRELKSRAESENRKIIAFSEHEADVARRFANVDLLPMYKNARIIARRLSSVLSEHRYTNCRTLTDFLDLVNFQYPQHIGQGLATTRLRIVQESIRHYGAYERWPEAVKREWRYLLEYNRLDCEGLKYLMQQTVGISTQPRSAA